MAPKAVKLATNLVHLRPDGTATVVPSRGGRHPDIEGRLVGEVLMSKPAPHGGERHIDGDELLYLISGSVHVSLDHEDQAPEVIELAELARSPAADAVAHLRRVGHRQRVTLLTATRDVEHSGAQVLRDHLVSGTS